LVQVGSYARAVRVRGTVLGMDSQARRVSVAARLRPAFGAELTEEVPWLADGSRRSVTDRRTGDTWTFDHVFGPEAANGDVYSSCCAEVVRAFCNGVNGTVLAYGQTCAGKTHTMQDAGGVVPRAVEEIFSSMQRTEREFVLTASYLEIYNEQVSDLLAEKEVNLLEGPQGLVMQNMSSVLSSTVEDVLDCVSTGQRKRQVGETSANVASSRSHSILLLNLESRQEGEEGVRCSQLSLVDLAGSEGMRNVEHSSKELRRESSFINKSLLALTSVINALSERGSKETRVGFRDSKLTRILQSSLGGNAQTVMICALAPGAMSRNETRSTLDFASRASKVENKVCVNFRSTVSAQWEEGRSKILERELSELRAALEAQNGGSGGVAELTEENAALRKKIERLQSVFSNADSRSVLVAPTPCRLRRQSAPARPEVVDDCPPLQYTPRPDAKHRRRAGWTVPAKKAVSSELRQPGWRSQRNFRGDTPPQPPDQTRRALSSAMESCAALSAQGEEDETETRRSSRADTGDVDSLCAISALCSQAKLEDAHSVETLTSSSKDFQGLLAHGVCRVDSECPDVEPAGTEWEIEASTVAETSSDGSGAERASFRVLADGTQAGADDDHENGLAPQVCVGFERAQLMSLAMLVLARWRSVCLEARVHSAEQRLAAAPWPVQAGGILPSAREAVEEAHLRCPRSPQESRDVHAEQGDYYRARGLCPDICGLPVGRVTTAVVCAIL